MNSTFQCSVYIYTHSVITISIILHWANVSERREVRFLGVCLDNIPVHQAFSTELSDASFYLRVPQLIYVDFSTLNTQPTKQQMKLFYISIILTKLFFFFKAPCVGNYLRVNYTQKENSKEYGTTLTLVCKMRTETQQKMLSFTGNLHIMGLKFIITLEYVHTANSALEIPKPFTK